MTGQLPGRIAFASGKTGDYDLWVLDLPTGELTQVTFGQFWNDKPAWSPDGGWIAYVSNRTGLPEIFKTSLETGETVQLTNVQRWMDSPAFSPDGTRIAFVSNESGNNDIWIMDAEGRQREQVTQHEGSDTHVSWTPDGDGLLWSSDRDEGDADIWHLNLRTGEKRQLTNAPGADITPIASPDGRLIAFVSNRPLAPNASQARVDRDKDVWVMAADGSHPVRVTSSQGADYCPCWSPDGKYLLYTSSTDRQANHLRLVDVSELAEAYRRRDPELIQRTAAALCAQPLPLNRSRLEAEIDARRNSTFVTALLPDRWMRALYPRDYFGQERYPAWTAARVEIGSQTAQLEKVAVAPEEIC